jgi:hypothetical protein
MTEREPIFELAWRIHDHACDLWPGLPTNPFVAPDDPRIARPFGRPDAMPEHRWRVSRDVMQALTEASPPPSPAPNPKTSAGITKLLFGWPVDVDKATPPGTLLLERAP